MYLKKHELINIIWPLENNKNIYRHGICNYIDDFGTHFEIIFKYKEKPHRVIYTLKSSPSELTDINFSIHNIKKEELIKYLDDGIFPTERKDKYEITPVILKKTIEYEWINVYQHEVDKKQKSFMSVKSYEKYENFRTVNNIIRKKEIVIIPELTGR